MTKIDIGCSLKLCSVFHIRGLSMSISRAHCDTNSTDRDKMIKACDSKVA